MAVHVTGMHIKNAFNIKIQHHQRRSTSEFYVFEQTLILQSAGEPESQLHIELFFPTSKLLVMYLEELKKLDPSNCEEVK